MDMKCVVCGEPWDSYGVNHGDMMAWEADLFRKGAGCPSCEGVKPEQAFEPKTLSDLDNGDGDPMERIQALENAQAGTAPKWVKPDNEVIHKCDGCKVELLRLVGEEVYDGNKREKVYGWHTIYKTTSGRRSVYQYDKEDPAEAAEDHNWHPFSETETVCPLCLTKCSHCSALIFESNEDFNRDPYDSGYACLPEGCYHDLVCMDCLDEVESENAREAFYCRDVIREIEKHLGIGEYIVDWLEDREQFCWDLHCRYAESPNELNYRWVEHNPRFTRASLAKSIVEQMKIEDAKDDDSHATAPAQPAQEN